MLQNFCPCWIVDARWHIDQNINIPTALTVINPTAKQVQPPLMKGSAECILYDVAFCEIKSHVAALITGKTECARYSRIRCVSRLVSCQLIQFNQTSVFIIAHALDSFRDNSYGHCQQSGPKRCGRLAVLGVNLMPHTLAC